MSYSLTSTFSLLFRRNGDATNSNYQTTNADSLPATNSPLSLQPYKLLSTELWLLILSNLDRNNLDNCELVCVWWHELIRYNSKYLSGRVIDYIIFSTKRAFSMILSSGDIVKIYRYDKYFTLRNVCRPIDDPSFVTVHTYRRSRIRSEPSLGSDQLKLFFEELRLLTYKPHDALSSQNDYSVYCGRDGIGLRHLAAKSSYKIRTPPVAFFVKLNKLLRNLSHVNYLVFQSFTLTDAFVERFIHYVEPKMIVKNIERIRSNFTKHHNSQEAARFFFSVILGNKQILEDPQTHW